MTAQLPLQGARHEGLTLALAVAVCTVPFALMVAAALTGWRIGGLVALAWAALAACLIACTGRTHEAARRTKTWRRPSA